MSGTKQIPLSRGLFATVDEADFDWLNQWKWSASRQGRKNCAKPKWRAVRMEWLGDGKQRTVLMHRQIAGPNPGEVIDHWDGKPLNNRRLNLRITTQRGNSLNSASHSDAGSRFKGVCWHKGGKKWMANFRGKYPGLFNNEEDAARACDDAALKYSLEYARLNFPIGG